MTGALTASEPVVCKTSAEIKVELDKLTLAVITDRVMVTPAGEGQWLVYKVEVAA